MARPNVAEILEDLIDTSSLLDVLTGLELVCGEKAEHIRHNWQDNALARRWEAASRVCDKAARDPKVADLP